MRLTHPGSDGDDWVYVGGSRYAVDDGIIDCPESDAKKLATNYGTTVEALAVDGGLNQQSGGDDGDSLVKDTEICGTEKSDGEICERPADECPYHS